MYQPDVGSLLHQLVARGGSDLHIEVGSPSRIRIDGEMEIVEGAESLRPDDTQEMISGSSTPVSARSSKRSMSSTSPTPIPGLSRFRVNVFYQRGAIGSVFRTIPIRIPTSEELGLPPIVLQLALRPRGLVLVTGPTGSGKSTTLAAMVDHVNKHRTCHIITIEDPIEFVHRAQVAVVNQREVGPTPRASPTL